MQKSAAHSRFRLVLRREDGIISLFVLSLMLDNCQSQYKNTWMCSVHFSITTDGDQSIHWWWGFTSTYLSCIRYTNITALCFECHHLHNNGHSTTKKNNNNSKEKERKNLQSKKSANLFRGPSETTGPLLQQLLVPAHYSQRRLYQAGLPHSLLSAYTKLWTKGCWQAEVKWCTC